MTALIEDFIGRTCAVRRTNLVPEIALHLARDADGIFAARDAMPPEIERYPPYWAFAWPGGQATARWLLDNPDAVRGKCIVDLGAGSGMAALAAAMAGAAQVLAADVDPMAAAAVRLNARLNGVTVQTTTADILGTLPPADLVLIGDLVYEPDLAVRVAGLLDGALRNGLNVLLADRTSARRPPLAFTLVAEYAAPLTPTLAAHPSERARLWQLRRGDRKAGA